MPFDTVFQFGRYQSVFFSGGIFTQRPFQADCGAKPLRNDFRRLLVRQIRFHAAWTFSNPHTSLIRPKTGSTICLRLEQVQRPFTVRSLRAMSSLIAAPLGIRLRGAGGGRPIVLLFLRGQVRVDAPPCQLQLR